MKVAIIGAGLSGLTCALELEKNGIQPDIFEKKFMIGEVFDHCGALLEVVSRPAGDPLEYLKNNFGLDIKPIRPINSIYMHGPNANVKLKKNYLGYFLSRGEDKSSVENQLYSDLMGKVKFDTAVDYRDVMKDYDYVIIATGDNSVSKAVGCWQELVDIWLYGCEVIGTFDPSCLQMWMDTRYSKSGYAYLTPYSNKRATLALAVPYIGNDEIDYYWDKFREIVKLPYSIVKTFKCEHISGFVKPMIYENMFFVGNAAGGLDSFLGFGQEFALISGIYAARAICKGEDYENNMKGLVNKDLNLLELRKALDKLDNKNIDLLMKALGFPFFRRLVYSTDLNVVKNGSFLVKELFNRFKLNYRR